jgi:ABC-three component (ABC-3C) system Middle Component 8
MLSPRKHLNLDVSVLRISAILLRELSKRGVVELERLRAIVVRRTGADGELSFLPALNFLYLLGKVEYHLKNDTVEFRSG